MLSVDAHRDEACALALFEDSDDCDDDQGDEEWLHEVDEAIHGRESELSGERKSEGETSPAGNRYLFILY